MVFRRHKDLRARQELALGLSGEGRVEEALATLDEAVEVVRRTRRAPRGAYADLVHLRAFVLSNARRLEESETAAREAIDVRRDLGALDADQSARLASSMELLANVLIRSRRTQEAVTLSAEVVAMRGAMPWPEQARGMLNRAAALLEAGREAEGLQVALDLVRGAVARPGQTGLSDPSFVLGLINLGVLLRRAGRWSEAIAVQDRAVTELRVLAEAGAPETTEDLAKALSNLALMHLECGHRELAVAPGEEALAIREQLAGASFGAYAPELAESLNNHAVLLHKLERHEEAEPVARRCVELRRRLHATQPWAYERALANALTTHAEMLTHRGRGIEAVGVAREAVERFRSLEEAEPGLHTSWLAGSLDTLAGALAAAGEETEAYATSTEAAARARTAYDTQGAGAGDLLGQILLACAERHALGRLTDARRWADEAVALLEVLSVDQPGAHAVALARAGEVRAALGR